MGFDFAIKMRRERDAGLGRLTFLGRAPNRERLAGKMDRFLAPAETRLLAYSQRRKPVFCAIPWDLLGTSNAIEILSLLTKIFGHTFYCDKNLIPERVKEKSLSYDANTLLKNISKPITLLLIDGG